MTTPAQPPKIRPGPEEPFWGKVLCRHGIHSGKFPIAGMRLGDVRPVLARLLNFDDRAVAVVNGRKMSDDDIIGDGVECLVFMNPTKLDG